MRAATPGLLATPEPMTETLLAIRRAGADLIVTYFAKEAAQILKKG